jgi:hypothetical protein
MKKKQKPDKALNKFLKALRKHKIRGAIKQRGIENGVKIEVTLITKDFIKIKDVDK